MKKSPARARTPRVAAIPRVVPTAMQRFDDLDEALVAMYYGWKGITREADDVLAQKGFGRAHYRMMFVIARRDGLSISELRATLGISAQAMQRPLKQLRARGLVAVSRDPNRHRFKALHLTEKGRGLEAAASDAERRVIRQAFEAAGDEAARGWRTVMLAIAEEA